VKWKGNRAKFGSTLFFCLGLDCCVCDRWERGWWIEQDDFRVRSIASLMGPGGSDERVIVLLRMDMRLASMREKTTPRQYA
jgi:hypothetical protein